MGSKAKPWRNRKPKSRKFDKKVRDEQRKKSAPYVRHKQKWDD